MKPAEVKRTLVRDRVVRRKRDGKVVRVRVRTYRVERPVVQEVRVVNSRPYATEYRPVLGDDLVSVYEVAGVLATFGRWQVWAEDDDGLHRTEATIDGRDEAERHARKMLRAAGYRVRRAQ